MNTLTKCKITKTKVSDESFDFGLVDNKGRAIGYYCVVFKVVFEQVEDQGPGHSYYLHDPGTFYWALTGNTRDGHSYGPSHPYIEDADLDQVKLLAYERRLRSQKRFALAFSEAA